MPVSAASKLGGYTARLHYPETGSGRCSALVVLSRPRRSPRHTHGAPCAVYTSESDLHQGKPIHRALIRRLRESAAARGATAVRGIWSFQ
ncbi:MAG: DUF190 domain-containing protein [Propionibacteriales bacterium]|nr:DUF190 domain-containing protein [Propionibacteriales bacterium]